MSDIKAAGEGHNGMAATEIAEMHTLRADISTIIQRIGKLPRHRSYSLAITNLDQARHWLNDRKDRLPSGGDNER